MWVCIYTYVHTCFYLKNNTCLCLPFFFSEAIYYLQKQVTLDPCLRVNATAGGDTPGSAGEGWCLPLPSPCSSALHRRKPQSSVWTWDTPQLLFDSECASRAILFPALPSPRISACKGSARNGQTFLISAPLGMLWLPVYLGLYNFYFFTIQLGLKGRDNKRLLLISQL